MSYSVRRLTRADAAAYRQVRLDSLRDHPEAYASVYESAVQRPEASWIQTVETLALFGAFAPDGALIGLVGFMQEDGDKDRHRGWLIQMYVRPHMRGTGCAMGLV
ncbi:GNAT family N-acetyltransferase, partial [Devosia sp.]|uniref:GNAT family N-acetyltransferase n=1 Tax=Devosia sp. TaxID=1871048 RepID=UPI002FC99CC7